MDNEMQAVKDTIRFWIDEDKATVLEIDDRIARFAKESQAWERLRAEYLARGECDPMDWLDEWCRN